MAGIAHTAVPSVNPPKAALRLSHPKLLGGWSTNPFEKYAQVKLDHFPNFRG